MMLMKVYIACQITRVECSSEQLIARENHKILDQTGIRYALLLKVPSSNEIWLNTHTIHIGLSTGKAVPIMLIIVPIILSRNS